MSTIGQETIDRIERKRAGLHLLALNIGDDLESEAKRTAAWTDRTGNTRRNIHGGADKTRKGSTIYLAHGTQVGLYLEEGTGLHGPRKRAYDIFPKNKKALFWNGARHPVVAVRNHPGMAARPVIKPTVDSQIDHITDMVERYWEKS